VASNSETNVQTNAEKEPKVILIRVLTKSELFFLGFKVFFYTWIGSTFLLLALASYGIALPLNTALDQIIFYAVWFLIPILSLIPVARRNHFFKKAIEKPNSHRKILKFHYSWKILVPILTGLLMFYYFVYGFHDVRYFMVTIPVFFFFSALYMIFENPLTQEGEIYILFELLSSPITNFHEAVKNWERLAGKIEKMLRFGEIQVSSKDFVHNFSKSLLENTGDFSNDLISIRDWMLGRTRSCFEGLKHIYPEIKLTPCKKNFFIDWGYQNPEKVLKYGFTGFLILAVIIFSPDSLSSILKYLGFG
jgi:hypothetical protein